MTVCGWLWNKWCLGHGPTQISGAALLPPLPASEAKSLPLSQYLICFLTWTRKKGQALTLQVSAMSGNKLHWGGERKKPLNLCVGVKARQDTRCVLCSCSTAWVSLPALHTVRCWEPFAPKFFSTANSQWLVQPSIAREPPWSSSVCVPRGCKEGFGSRELSCLMKCVLF